MKPKKENQRKIFFSLLRTDNTQTRPTVVNNEIGINISKNRNITTESSETKKREDKEIEKSKR